MRDTFILLWFICISAVGVLMTVYDKLAAVHNGKGQTKHKKRRVPERTLLLIGFLGAAAPIFFTMLCIRHKTRHKKFTVGLPLEILLQATAFLCFYGYL
ncbi:MAG: DUF1294 domain-containing protein [Candidatus Fimenecus sp.]